MNNIRYLRELHHLTQAALAFQLNLTPAQLGRRERGEVALRGDEISQLMKIFNCTYEKLMGGEIHASKSTEGLRSTATRR